jgi:hypothetical protein
MNCGGGGGGGGGGGSSTSGSASVDIDIEPVLAISLEQSAINFGNAFSGDTPAAAPERVTVVSNSGGYSLTVHRSAFSPSDLPLGLTATAPSGATLNPVFAGGARVSVPIAPTADLLIGTGSAASGSGGDAWPTTVGFTAPLPVVAPGHYSATLTYTLIGA